MMRSTSKKPKLRWKAGMSPPRFPSDKSVEVVVTLKAYRDQAGIFGPHGKPGFEVNDQVGDNNQDAVVAVAEVLNQFRHGFMEGGVPEYAEAFSGALDDLMAKHWPEGTQESTQLGPPVSGAGAVEVRVTRMTTLA
jgi:hypothetical protein